MNTASAMVLANFFIWPERTLPLEQLLPAAFVLAAVLATAAGVTWYRKFRERMEPVKIFRDLARNVGLEPADCRELSRIARQEKLTSPITLLLSPSTLDHHAENVARQLRDDEAQALRKHVKQIALHLFGPINDTVER